MDFATRLQTSVANLLSQLGNSCVLSKVTKGTYDPLSGRTADTKVDINTFSTSMGNSSMVLSTSGSTNFNLSGFDKDKLLIPYQQGYTVDETWLYNSKAIETIEKIEARNTVIAYIIKVRG